MAQVQTDLTLLATAAGAVDATDGDAPIVVAGPGNEAATALTTVIETVARNSAFGVVANLEDDGSDSVDAVATFVERIETNQSGVGTCTNGLIDADTNMDTFADAFEAVPSQTPLCFNIVPKTNATIEETEAPALFRLDVRFTADQRISLGDTEVYFLVPPSEAI